MSDNHETTTYGVELKQPEKQEVTSVTALGPVRRHPLRTAKTEMGHHHHVTRTTRRGRALYSSYSRRLRLRLCIIPDDVGCPDRGQRSRPSLPSGAPSTRALPRRRSAPIERGGNTVGVGIGAETEGGSAHFPLTVALLALIDGAGLGRRSSISVSVSVFGLQSRDRACGSVERAGWAWAWSH